MGPDENELVFDFELEKPVSFRETGFIGGGDSQSRTGLTPNFPAYQGITREFPQIGSESGK